MKEKYINYKIMCIINLLQGLIFYGPITTIYRENHGINISQILILESILVITILLFEIPWGVFADKYGYKNTLIICVSGLFISKIFLYNAYSFNMFFIQTIISGISLAGISGCDYAIIFESVDPSESEKAFGVYQAFGTLGFFIASIGSSILVKYSLNSTVFITIIAYGICSIFTVFLKSTGKENKKTINKNNSNFLDVIKEFKNNKKIGISFIIFIISIFIIYEVGHSIEVYLIQLQYVRSNINYIYFGIITACAQLLCMLSAKTYIITKKIGQLKTLVLFIIIVILSVAILINTFNPIISIIFSIIIQISIAMLMPILIDIQNKSINENSSNRATILSVYSMIGSVIGIIVNLIISYDKNNSVGNLFEICLILLMISFLFIIVCVIFNFIKNNKKK